MISTKLHLRRPRSGAGQPCAGAQSPAIDEASAWLRGEGDLLTAGMGRPVPVTVQLGVLAHAGIERLNNLGRYCRRGSVRRAWGIEMAELAGELASLSQSPQMLRRLQAEFLIPLENEVLAGRRNIVDRQELIFHIRGTIPLFRVRDTPATA